MKIKLVKFNKLLNEIDENLLLNLKQTPLLMLIVALNIKNFKQGYQKLDRTRQNLAKIIFILQLAYRVMRSNYYN